MVLALASQTKNTPSYLINKEKADMVTKSGEACMGHLILIPCSVTAEGRTAEMHFIDFIQKQWKALNLLRNTLSCPELRSHSRPGTSVGIDESALGSRQSFRVMLKLVFYQKSSLERNILVY